VVGGILADPFAFLDVQEERVEILDLGDGTAAVLWDDEPALGGFVCIGGDVGRGVGGGILNTGPRDRCRSPRRSTCPSPAGPCR